MRNTLTQLAILALGLGLFLAETQARVESPALDVNDVSLLFPIKSKAPYPAISLETDLQFPKRVFEQVIRFENPDVKMDRLPYLDGKFVGNISRWFVTSFRFDHCGEAFHLSDITDPTNGQQILLAERAPGCQPRLRFVVQPFNIFGNPVATAIHVLYQVEPAQVSAIAKTLLGIKQLANSAYGINTSGLPLIQHPALVAEAKNPSAKTVLADSLRVALLAMSSEGQGAKLEVVTLSLQVVIDSWKFTGGYVQNGNWKRFVTPFSAQFNDGTDKSIGLGVEELACNGNAVCLFRPGFQPALSPDSGVSLSYIFQNKSEMKAQQVSGHRSDKLKLESEIVDNPLRTHFFNTNCISCHSSSNLRDSEKFHSDLNVPPGVTPFVPKKFTSPLMNNVINFGYWGVVPRISNRTAADSTFVAEALNQELNLKSEIKIDDLQGFWKCLSNSENHFNCLLDN
jgi:hypothetical protein